MKCPRTTTIRRSDWNVASAWLAWIETNNKKEMENRMTLEERTERNKGLKRGGNLIGLMDGEVVIGSDQECRVMQDIKDVMVERNIIGDVVVMRECGTVTRKVVQKTMFG